MRLYCAFIILLLSTSAIAQIKEPEKKEIAVSTSTITAEDVIKKYIDAIGGEKVLKKIKDVRITRSAIVQQVPITITELRKTPDQIKIMVEGMDMVFQKVVVGKDSAYQEYMGKRSPLSPAEVTGTRAEADLLAKLDPGKYKVTRRLKGMDMVDSVNTYVIEETDAVGKTYQFYYDAQNGLLLRKLGSEQTPQGIMVTLTTYHDYTEVEGSGGYKIPKVVKQAVGEQMTTVSTLKSAEVNKGVDDVEFR